MGLTVSTVYASKKTHLLRYIRTSFALRKKEREIAMLKRETLGEEEGGGAFYIPHRSKTRFFAQFAN